MQEAARENPAQSDPGDNHTAAILVRFGFVVLAVLCFTGLTSVGMDTAMAPVYERNSAYLQKSLGYSGAAIAGITTAKVGVSVLESVSLKISGSGFEPGRALEPVNDLLSDITDYMLGVSLLIVLQVALIAAIKAVSLTYVLGAGALMCAFSSRRLPWTGQAGTLLMTAALAFYLLYPTLLYGASYVFEGHQEDASAEFSRRVERLEISAVDFSGKLGDIASLDGVGSMRERAADLFGDFKRMTTRGLSTVWHGMLDLMVAFVIMFVLTPLFALGVTYLCIRHAALSMQAGEPLGPVDRTVSAAYALIGRRTRARISRAE